MKLITSLTSLLLLSTTTFAARPVQPNLSIDLHITVDSRTGKARLANSSPINTLSEVECGQDNFYYKCGKKEPPAYSACEEYCVCTRKGQLECTNPCGHSSSIKSSTLRNDEQMSLFLAEVDKDFTEFCQGGPSCFCY